MAVLKYSKSRQKWFRLKHHYADVLEKNGYDTEARTISTCHEVSHLAGCKECQNVRYILHKCGHRLCPICSYHVSRMRADFLQRISAKLAHPKLVTLTIPSQGNDHAGAFQALIKGFRSLRRDPLFRHVKGGAYSYEVIPHEDYFHIHLHLLIDSPYIPIKILFSAWRRILNTRYASVDVRAATNAKAREYITKYAAKNHSISTNPDLIWKLYEAIKGRRLFGTFGTWYNAKLDDDPTADDPKPTAGVCPFCGCAKGFFWIRHGPFIFGNDAWKEMAPFYGEGHLPIEYHEILFEDKPIENKTNTKSGDVPCHSCKSDPRSSAMAEALAKVS